MSHKKYRQETNCLNCGAEVLGKFCPNCGQENIEQRNTFSHMLGHFISDYLHFDSKFFRSLIPLFIRPGFLTKEYWEGRRVKYIPPVRLFFFVTIIFVLATSYFYNKFGAQLKNAVIHHDPGIGSLDSAYVMSLPDTSHVYVAVWKQKVAAGKLKKDMAKEYRQYRKLHAGMDTAFKNLKYVTFFLLPIYALIFKMLFFRKKSFYIDHLIYAMHLQTFAYVILSIAFVVPFAIKIDIGIIRQILFFIFLIYIGVSLHYLYHQKIWKTVVKSVIATMALFFVTFLAVVGTSVLDAVFVQ